MVNVIDIMFDDDDDDDGVFANLELLKYKTRTMECWSCLIVSRRDAVHHHKHEAQLSQR